MQQASAKQNLVQKRVRGISPSFLPPSSVFSLSLSPSLSPSPSFPPPLLPFTSSFPSPSSLLIFHIQHEMKKRVKEDERRKEVEEQREQQRKASRMLQGMKKASEKRQLEYRGVVQNQSSSTGM